MTRNPLRRRLPPLQAVGRSRNVELEDFPDDIITINGDNNTDSSSLSSLNLPTGSSVSSSFPTPQKYLREKQFLPSRQSSECIISDLNAERAESVSTALHDLYRILQPGEHHCRRIGTDLRTFTHCAAAARIAARYQHLEALLVKRARIEMMKDILSRVLSMSNFVETLRDIVREESRIYYDIVHDRLTREPTTRLNELFVLCEELRTQLNHWCAIKQRLHTDARLRTMLPSVCGRSCDSLKMELFELTDEAIYWLQRLVVIGFKVLGHCDIDRLAQDVLWNITRGLEDFNSIVDTIHAARLHAQNSIKNLPFVWTLEVLTADDISVSRRPSCENISRRMPRMSLTNVLRFVASERAKYAAVSAKNYFIGGKEIEYLLRSLDVTKDYLWHCVTDPISNIKSSADSTSLIQKENLSNFRADNNNSDTLFSTTGPTTTANFSSDGRNKSRKENPPGFRTYNNSDEASVKILRVTDNISAPDFSTRPSSLIDFARRESTFVARFLQVICNSTSLVKPRATVDAVDAKGSVRGSNARSSVYGTSISSSNYVHPRQQRMFSTKSKSSRTVIVPPINILLDDPETGMEIGMETLISGTGEILRGNSARKSVSWGDASHAVSIQSRTQGYLAALWHEFAARLFDSFVTVDWGTERLSSIVWCPDVVARLIQTLIFSTSFAETFPSGCRPALAATSRRLHATISWIAWDSAIRAALSSGLVDKCQPTSVSKTNNGLPPTTTLTAKLLCESYQPLYAVLPSLIIKNTAENKPQLNDSVNIAASPSTIGCESDPDLLYRHTVDRLLITDQAVLAWTGAHALNLLTDRTISQFLLVAYADIKVLLSEMSRSTYILRKGMRDWCELSEPEQMEHSHLSKDEAGLFGCKEMKECIDRFETQRDLLTDRFRLYYMSLCYDFFRTDMPAGKEWKRKMTEGQKYTQHNSYIEQAVNVCLESVIAGVNRLYGDAQTDVLEAIVNSFHRSWMDVILVKRIKFSYHGACQLEADVQYVRTWLDSHVTRTHSRIFSLDALRYVDAVVNLLQQQPPNIRSGSLSRIHPVKTERPKGSASSFSCDSEGAQGVALYKIPHHEQWLSLRADTGSPWSWVKFTSCFDDVDVVT